MSKDTMKDAWDMTVRELTLDEVLPLRTRVLRPHLGPGQLARYDEDALDSTCHYGVVDGSGAILAVATFLDRPCPLDPTTPAVQLRGMAVDEAHRDQGLGARLLEAVMPRLALRFSERELVWCNARLRAASFYRRLGFETAGDPFEIAGIGPHYLMWRRLPTLYA
jgi:predicted GNAT family N-acyltransferase